MKKPVKRRIKRDTKKSAGPRDVVYIKLISSRPLSLARKSGVAASAPKARSNKAG